MKIAVIGGGIGGLAAAWGVAKAGCAVTLFDKDTLGAGASGQALGALVAVGPHVRGRLARVERESVAQWPALAAELAQASRVPVEGFFRTWADDGGNGPHQLRLPLFFAVFAQALLARGVTVQEGMATAPEAALAQGFDRVIVATGWQNKALAGQDLRVIAGQAVRLRLRTGSAVPTLRYQDGLHIVPCWVEDWAERGRPEVLVGSVNTVLEAPGHGVPDVAVTAELLARAQAVEPLLAGAEVVGAWVGYRPAVRIDGNQGLLPLVRVVNKQVVVVTGLGKIGFCLAPALVQASAESAQDTLQ